ncbi:MAG: hypothetical protein KAU38_01255, partial [Desulfobacterales bacterium]|nr:hypothetical protein [Desulfobacterales bacterium]
WTRSVMFSSRQAQPCAHIGFKSASGGLLFLSSTPFQYSLAQTCITGLVAYNKRTSRQGGPSFHHSFLGIAGKPINGYNVNKL